MSLAENFFLPQPTQNLPLARNLGDALAAVAKTLWPQHTASKAESNWELDRSTAKNLTKGVVGSVVVTRAIRAQEIKHGDAWLLWDALGELIIGRSRAAFVAERLAKEKERLAHECAAYDAEMALLGKMAGEVGPALGLGDLRPGGGSVLARWAAGQSARRLGDRHDARDVAEPKTFADGPRRRR